MVLKSNDRSAGRAAAAYRSRARGRAASYPPICRAGRSCAAQLSLASLQVQEMLRQGKHAMRVAGNCATGQC
jgi:hypothetical protein